MAKEKYRQVNKVNFDNFFEEARIYWQEDGALEHLHNMFAILADEFGDSTGIYQDAIFDIVNVCARLRKDCTTCIKMLSLIGIEVSDDVT